jgi:hypothetical protein
MFFTQKLSSYRASRKLHLNQLQSLFAVDLDIDAEIGELLATADSNNTIELISNADTLNVDEFEEDFFQQLCNTDTYRKSKLKLDQLSRSFMTERRHIPSGSSAPNISPKKLFETDTDESDQNQKAIVLNLKEQEHNDIVDIFENHPTRSPPPQYPPKTTVANLAPQVEKYDKSDPINRFISSRRSSFNTIEQNSSEHSLKSVTEWEEDKNLNLFELANEDINQFLQIPVESGKQDPKTPNFEPPFS